MKLNHLLMDIARGEWLMSFEGLKVYAPIAHQIMMGQTVAVDKQNIVQKFFKESISPGTALEINGRLLTVLDKTGSALPTNEDGQYEKVPKGSVAVVNMVGAAVKYGDWCTYGSEEIAGALRAADDNPNIRFTIFVIDGPGGAVSAIGPLLEFKKSKKKPVIGLADQCCSLHFWALVAVCDHKLADNDVSALFGSVGVVCNFMDNREFLESLGYKFHEIYPEESKHKNEAFRLALEGNYDMIKEEHLSPLARKFQGAVVAGCPKLKQNVVGVLTGKTFGADLALEYGMIDGIGGMGKALEMGEILSEIKQFK
ncbi:hypothetical protein [Flavobacterium psychrotrophum]|uniref:hypothetical protein n=1 Tax=Flavobacterium psychrotrophum TaxID=2294119 RepID=UPI000E314DA1|nr:hypothetical protein [Flavobacterium psychrotrophum]